jgi:hypothetical protein
MTLFIDIQYFAPFSFYKISYKFSNIVFEQYETWQKMSFRNRCRIAGAEGVIDLSIPLVGGRDQKTLMKEVRISDDKSWRDRHWKTIVSCYNRSPWFGHYRDELETLYRRPATFLVDWNLRCFEWSMKALGMTRGVALTDRYQKSYGPEDGADWRGKIVPGSSAMEGQAADGIAGEPAAAPYRQVFEERIGFIPGLSILDLLFCEGKNAIRYIQS